MEISRDIEEAGYHVSVEIKQDNEDLALSMKEKMEIASFSHCISRIPETLIKKNEDFYVPKLVSIGPYHHNDHDLKETQQHKWRYLSTLLNRKPNPEAALESCITVVKELEPKIRKCYKETITLDSDKLVEIMVLDGCFLIELFFKYSMKDLRRRDDIFFNTKGMFYRLRCDIILLENQIPFFVLQRLFSLVPIPIHSTRSLTDLALFFFKKLIPFPGYFKLFQAKFGQEFNHLLDLIHNCYLPTYQNNHPTTTNRNLSSAKELQKRGIAFKKATTESLLNMRFSRGVLQIPPLEFNEYTEIVFRNLIAFEECYYDGTKHVSSYAFVMASLVRSRKDARLLYNKRILEYGLKEEEIVELLKKVHVEVDLKEFYYKGLCENVNGYRRSSWGVGKWCMKMKNGYWRSPWGFIGFILAIVFIVLALIGTLFSVLSFTLHHH